MLTRHPEPAAPAASPPRPDGAAGVHLRGLTKSFRTPQGPVHAVRGIDLDIPAGETVALLGPNGAGKSTTIEMLLGLTPPDAGEATVFGRSPTDAVADGLVAAMLQTGALIHDLSVRELVTMAASLYPDPLGVDEVLEQAGLADIAGHRTQKLSGGQVQRTRFAVALVANPRLLVLDEPTVALDVEGRHAFWAAMRTFVAGGRTVVFATHYLEEADEFADRVVLVARGGIVADGTPAQIKGMVGRRTIRATVPDADLHALAGLPGVATADRRGDTLILHCADADQAIRALLRAHPDAHDLEITGAGLEQAFLELTGDDRTTGTTAQEATR